MKSSRLLSVLGLVLLLVFSAGLRAQTASEPTVHQIYETASRGDLPGAQSMIDDVIKRHPQSAKAHYVKAELATRAGDAATARSELQAAEKLAPGLPFAKPDAVSALRSQVDRLGSTGSRTPAPSSPPRSDPRRMGAGTDQGGGGFPVGGLLLVAVIGGGLWLFLRRRRAASYDARGPVNYGPAPGNPYARDDAFGRGPAPGYPPPGYDPYGQPPPQAGGMGSALARGLGAGLAMGAGAVAAQEIGRRMFAHGQDGSSRLQDAPPHEHGAAANSSLAHDAGLDAFGGGGAPAPDLGGEDFGIADNGSWDDGGGGGFDDVGGGDWDR